MQARVEPERTHRARTPVSPARCTETATPYPAAAVTACIVCRC